MRKSYALLVVIFMASLGLIEAKAQTVIDAEFRPRLEYREGAKKPLADTLNPAIVTVQRTRLNFDYKGAVLNSRLSVQDTHTWGNSNTKTNPSSLSLYEAWAEYLLLPGTSVKIGRQPLKYDDQRLLAAPEWSATGASHDVMVLKYKTSEFQVHGGGAYNNDKDTLLDVAYAYAAAKMYKSMGYGWLSHTIYKGTTLSGIAIVEGFESPTNYQTDYARATYGGNLVYSNDSAAWGATLTGYYQQGKDINKAAGKGYADLNAYFWAFKASYKYMQKYAVNVGIDYYSGSASTIAADKSKTFNRLYGSVHSYNGSMEYFSKLPTQGLVDYYAGFKAKVTPKFSVDLAGHLFYFDHNFYYKKVLQEKSLGSEADLALNYTVSKEFAIQGGYSRYFNSGSTKNYYKMNGVDTHPQQWAYLMITIRPQLYKTPAVVANK